MFASISLLSTVAMGLWLAFDVVTRTPRVRRTIAIATCGIGVAMWAGSELALLEAQSAQQRLIARRVLYLATVLLPVAWLALSAQAARARWMRERPLLLAVIALPGLLCYSTLYWDTTGLLVSPSAPPPPTKGPLFAWHFIWAWAVVGVGVGYLIYAARQLGRPSGLRYAAIAAAALVPFVGDVAYVTLSQSAFDPTPIFLLVSVLLVRFSIFDSGLSGLIPVARKDLIEQLRHGVVVFDLDDQCVDANPAAHALLGRPERLDLHPEELRQLAHERSDRVLELETFDVCGPIGSVGSCVVITDRTEASRSQQQMIRAGKLEALGALTAGIAHEVNNPLAFIQANAIYFESFIKRLKEPATWRSLPDSLRRELIDVEEAVVENIDGIQRIAEMVASLKTFAHEGREAPSRAPTSLLAVAERARTLAAVGFDRSCISIRGHAPRVLANANEIVQVIVNLLVNAVQASEDEPRIVMTLEARGEMAFLEVRDHGPGISAADLPLLFEPFFTTKAVGRGTGLGLSLSLDLARRNGGRLEAANHPDGGACMSLWLPVADG